MIKLLKENDDPKTFFIHLIKSKIKIWKALLEMLDRNQISFIKIKNRIQHRKFLNQFSSCDIIPKKYFGNPMEEKHLQRHFGKHIQISI